jgi:hypothetical protein
MEKKNKLRCERYEREKPRESQTHSNRFNFSIDGRIDGQFLLIARFETKIFEQLLGDRRMW